MSGPQGSEPNPWQVSGADTPASGDAAGSWQPAGSEAPAWQPPAYTPQQYPQYGQPPMPGYPAQPYAAPAEYNPAAYGQPGQYGQPAQYGQPGQYGVPPQYGQYPPPPGQYPPAPGQYPPYVPPGAEGEAKSPTRMLGTILGAVAALALLAVLVLGFWKPGFFVTTKLDVNKAQQGVQQILTDESNGYGAKNVQDVKCNNGQNPTVKKGDTFTCEVSIDGTKRQVTVTFQDDKGTYEVGRPK
ncbi:MAG: DUF4333 domain-containing protein [Mycobacterium sp.]|nr:DUF4333 domain-containing protein [Mycobacterium sp.]